LQGRPILRKDRRNGFVVQPAGDSILGIRFGGTLANMIVEITLPPAGIG
jgi:hypothetical protein